ncbi:hypothetical protein OPT61_g9522 [Boeremia exigua]|uniref:Uncharacterized protein n=1 Tax=Boeremia exigua TaxID=749465 RepID=A0ACC2HTQ5_9PLEO|nr:hypothetical protein OPT61_g9522 [Boeremia exigua]
MFLFNHKFLYQISSTGRSPTCSAKSTSHSGWVVCKISCPPRHITYDRSSTLKSRDGQGISQNLKDAAVPVGVVAYITKKLCEVMIGDEVYNSGSSKRANPQEEKRGRVSTPDYTSNLPRPPPVAKTYDTSCSTAPDTEAKNDNKATTCHFLRLPTEIRLQIYAYADLGGHTIEVLHLPVIKIAQAKQCFRTYSSNPVDRELVYRLECANDQSRRAAERSHRRCFSVHGLFALTSVCRQVRADTQVLVYELNAFAFSDGNYNYSSAIRGFTRSLSAREIAAVHTVYWPLVNGLMYQRNGQGRELEELDRSCAVELGALKGLERVVLRYFGSEFETVREKHSEAEAAELQSLLADRGGRDYAIKRQFRRTLAVRVETLMNIGVENLIQTIASG